MKTSTAAKADLIEHLAGIQEIIEKAVNRYENEMSQEHKAILGSSTKAHITNDFMQYEANVYAGKNNLDTFVRQRMFLLIIATANGRYGIRLKKLDRYGNSNNIKTKQVAHYKGQEPFEEIENKVNLDAGYYLNEKTGDVEYFLAFPNNDSIQWVIDLQSFDDISLQTDMFVEDEDDDLTSKKPNTDTDKGEESENTGT